MMNQDFLDLITALNDAEARFLVVGAYAVGVHGHPRATKDLDIWIEASPDNASRVHRALALFGAPLEGIRIDDFATLGRGFMMGTPPRRIDILTEVSGISFADAWPRRIAGVFAAGVTCGVISLEDLIANKRAAARAQDIADVAALERVRRLRDKT